MREKHLTFARRAAAWGLFIVALLAVAALFFPSVFGGVALGAAMLATAPVAAVGAANTETPQLDAGGNVRIDPNTLADAIDRAIAARMNQNTPAADAGQQRAPEINPTGSDRAAVKGDRVSPWKKRTAAYFNALAEKDQARSIALQQEAAAEAARMPQQQMRDEEEEAKRIIGASALSEDRKRDLREYLEVGEYTRLHTTSTADTAKGGYLLPKPFLAELFVILESYSVVRTNFRMIPMTADKIDLKNVSTKPSVAWANEGANFTASDMVLSEQQMLIKKLAAITSWTTELEEDQAIALLPTVIAMFAESFGQKEDQAGLIGDGSAPYGSYTGLLNLAGATIVTMDATETTFDKVAEKHLRKMKNALSSAKKQGAAWYMHPSIKEQIAQLQAGTSGPRLMQESLTGEAPDRLLGFPIIEADVMPDLAATAVSKKFMVLGNAKLALMGQRRGVTADISREAILQDAGGAVIYNAFQGDGALLRLSERVGFAVPTAVQSAFVVLRTAAA